MNCKLHFRLRRSVDRAKDDSKITCSSRWEEKASLLDIHFIQLYFETLTPKYTMPSEQRQRGRDE